MNDRFKFRAWATETKKMYDNVYFDGLEVGIWDDDNDGEYTLIGDMRENSLLQYCILLQCTGLNDKNGKLIYEGDIIHGEYGMAWEVFHENSMYYAGGHSGDTYITKILEPALSMVSSVIGNIYENPELGVSK